MPKLILVFCLFQNTLICTQTADPAVQKNALNGEGTFRNNVIDIFWTILSNAVENWFTSRETCHTYRESRKANLTFKYPLKKNKFKRFAEGQKLQKEKQVESTNESFYSKNIVNFYEKEPINPIL